MIGHFWDLINEVRPWCFLEEKNKIGDPNGRCWDWISGVRISCHQGEMVESSVLIPWPAKLHKI